MKRLSLALLCPLLLAACSAQMAVDSEPTNATIPITSIGDPVYVEVAVDLPDETQELDVLINDVSATFAVYNPSTMFTLETSAKVSLTGTAVPDEPLFYYSESQLPAYYATAGDLLYPPRVFKPGERSDVSVTSPTLTQALGKQRVWIIVSNTITRAGIGTQPLPLEIRLENIVIHATVSKEFRGLEGLLGIGGL
ncbi:hypothetical protein [Melittangium boletus]|uniref:Lipoprotein n=1 Tax=Melittangium boletus DSM 14713 TaxID=1294270 RepID=A0A250ID88_9BACT|nr:hypothetical protein [Melittangium boletus]ATB29087.1 hypothetical protein MEBOL_002536 [Melittangium boletus DSM 14713]